jgi:hypothetical protein
MSSCHPYILMDSVPELQNILSNLPPCMACTDNSLPQYYVRLLPPYDSTHPIYSIPECFTEEQVMNKNEQICGTTETGVTAQKKYVLNYPEFFEEPKKASKNSTCDGNNFIKSETGYRQATQCVCAPYKSSHIHFVT